MMRGAVPSLLKASPYCGRARLKRDGTSAETRFGVSEKSTSPFKSAGESDQSTTGSRGVRISGQTMDHVPRYSARVVATLSNRLFPLHFPSHAAPCAITFRTVCTYLNRNRKPFIVVSIEAENKGWKNKRGREREREREWKKTKRRKKEGIFSFIMGRAKTKRTHHCSGMNYRWIMRTENPAWHVRCPSIYTHEYILWVGSFAEFC